MATEATLTPGHKRRLARLAKEAGCEPQDLLEDVFRFGFDFVEQDIHETSKGLAELAAGQGIPHSQVMAEARAIIERHAGKQKNGCMNGCRNAAYALTLPVLIRPQSPSHPH